MFEKKVMENMEKELELLNIGVDLVDEKIPKCKDYVFVDLQGFRGRNNQFICKEFCLVDGTETVHELISSPFPLDRLPLPLQCRADWLTYNHHGLSFDRGHLPFDELKANVFPKIQNKTVYVRGSEKVKWMEYMFRHCGTLKVINIADLGYTVRFTYPKEPCGYHMLHSVNIPDYACARSNAKTLQEKLDIFLNKH